MELWVWWGVVGEVSEGFWGMEGVVGGEVGVG